MRGAHRKHSFHGRDLGRVEAQRLIKRPRRLPSQKEGICEAGGEVCGLVGGARAWGGGDLSGMHREGLTLRLGFQARAERTRNMSSISVTLEVSKLNG